jgi:hypothetical protein
MSSMFLSMNGMQQALTEQFEFKYRTPGFQA